MVKAPRLLPLTVKIGVVDGNRYTEPNFGIGLVRIKAGTFHDGVRRK